MPVLSVPMHIVPGVERIEVIAASPLLRLDPHVTGPGFVGIVDADALLSSIDNQCRTGWVSRLAQLGDSGIVRLYAAEHVYSEVYRGLTEIARHRGCSVETLKRCFETAYLPNIIWVRVAPGFGDDPRVAAVTDETDVPTAVLASLIAPCMVYADDKSLRRPGFAPPRWRDAAGSGVRIVDAHDGQQAVTMAVALPAYGVVGGSVSLGRRVGLPAWLTVSILVALGFFVLQSPQRRKSMGAKVGPLVEFLGEEFARHSAVQTVATRELRPLMVQPQTPATTKQMAATVLARADEPMLSRRIYELTLDTFGALAPTFPELRRILAAEPEFIQPERYRWQLGNTLGNCP